MGVQDFNADGGNVYPTSDSLQSLVSQLHGESTLIQSTYPSQSKSGVIGGVNGSFEYHLTPELVVGANASYQKSADWNETTALGFARYTFVTAE